MQNIIIFDFCDPKNIGMDFKIFVLCQLGVTKQGFLVLAAILDAILNISAPGQMPAWPHLWKWSQEPKEASLKVSCFLHKMQDTLAKLPY